jgi:hypothetical protein
MSSRYIFFPCRLHHNVSRVFTFSLQVNIIGEVPEWTQLSFAFRERLIKNFL